MTDIGVVKVRVEAELGDSWKNLSKEIQNLQRTIPKVTATGSSGFTGARQAYGGHKSEWTTAYDLHQKELREQTRAMRTKRLYEAEMSRSLSEPTRKVTEELKKTTGSNGIVGMIGNFFKNLSAQARFGGVGYTGTVRAAGGALLKGAEGAMEGAGAGAAAGVAAGITIAITALIVIALALKEVVEFALQGVMKVLSAIFKVLGALLMPFVNLLIPFLMPILWLLAPIVRLVNMMMRPLYQYLMKNARNNMDFLSNMLSGGFLGILSFVLKVMATFLDFAVFIIKIAQSFWDFIKPAVVDAIKVLFDLYDIVLGIGQWMARGLAGIIPDWLPGGGDIKKGLNEFADSLETVKKQASTTRDDIIKSLELVDPGFALMIESLSGLAESMKQAAGAADFALAKFAALAALNAGYNTTTSGAASAYKQSLQEAGVWGQQSMTGTWQGHQGWFSVGGERFMYREGGIQYNYNTETGQLEGTGSYEKGGYVNETGPALLHEGEYVVPKGGGGGIGININVAGILDSDTKRRIVELVDRRLSEKMRMVSGA